MSGPNSPSQPPTPDADDADPALNAELLATMGFASFGSMRPKRKRGSDDTRPAKHGGGQGANALPLGQRKEARESARGGAEAGRREGVGEGEVTSRGDEAAAVATEQHSAQGYRGADAEMVEVGVTRIARGELRALAQGVTTANGDVAYFLPSFIEDPWARLAT